MVRNRREIPGASEEPYRSLQHLVWHITAILQSMEIMEGQAECRSLEDLVSRLHRVSALIELDLSTQTAHSWDDMREAERPR